jgi:hypothetical protein
MCRCSFYVGSTRDLEYRLQQHAIGCADGHTRSRRPLAFAWAEECERIEDGYVLPFDKLRAQLLMPFDRLSAHNCYVGANRNSTTSPSAIT